MATYQPLRRKHTYDIYFDTDKGRGRGVEGLGRNNKTIESEQTVEYSTPTTPKGWGRRGCKTATWFDKSLFALPHKTNSSLLGHFRIQMPEKDEYVVIVWTATTTWWWSSTMITKTTLEVQLCLFPLCCRAFTFWRQQGENGSVLLSKPCNFSPDYDHDQHDNDADDAD